MDKNMENEMETVDVAGQMLLILLKILHDLSFAQ